MKIMYDFVCKKCNKTVERLVKPTDEPKCSECGDTLVKQISTTNFKITGQGVYSPGMQYK